MYNGFVVYDYMRNNKTYDGNTLKFGITIDNENYIVKHAKDCISSIFSEHIASRFIRNLGISCHETYLGYYDGQMVVILKDFTTKSTKLRSYKSTRQSDEGTDLSGKAYTYKDVLYLISKHTKMSDENKRRTIIQFWDMFICDAILGNRDRHHGNWGYLACKDGYIPAPIYDNGASLFPDLATKINEYERALMENKEYIFIEQRAEKFPASLFQMERKTGEIKRTNYYEMLSDLRWNRTLAQEVKSMREKVGFSQVYESIFRAVSDAKDMIPYAYKRFYILIVCTRYLHMIERKSIKQSYLQSLRRLSDEVRQW